MTMPISIRWVLSAPIRWKWREMTSLSKDLTIENNAGSTGASGSSSYRRWQTDVCQLSFLGKSGYYLYRNRRSASLIHELLYRGNYRILFLVLPLLYSNIVNCIVNVIRISLPLPLLKVKNSVMFSKTVSWQRSGSEKSIFGSSVASLCGNGLYQLWVW